MSDQIGAMSLEFARDPDSLVFLRLGEALRGRGELDAASSVALAGLERYPGLPEARDLYARILLDLGHTVEANQVWQGVLAIEPRHPGAHKGLGFLYYSQGDLDMSLDHLETALSVDPTDESTVRAVRLVRATAAEAAADLSGAPVEETEAPVFHGLEGAETGILLADTQGRVLGGGLVSPEGVDVGEEVCAHLAGVGQEAERATRILGLGPWQWIIAEGESGNIQVTRPTTGTRLLVFRDRSVPTGRLAYVAAKANEAAAEWLERQGL